jgi:putative ABC transport system ATP-binding protein
MTVPVDVRRDASIHHDGITSAIHATHAIGASQITKSYLVGKQPVEILHGVSMSVGYGEMVAVMGPSGSGKSTLLYCLAGLEKVSSGEVALAGRPLASCTRAQLARMRRSEVGFVFQSYNLIPTLTAYENVALPYRLRRQRPPVELIEQTLAGVGLTDRAKARPPLMSGGEQQRVALARVLAQQPRIVFADEPTGALDTRSGTLVLAELKRIAHSPEQCVLVVTHDPSVAAQCDRILFMKDGRLERELRPRSVAEVAGVLVALSTGADGQEL